MFQRRIGSSDLLGRTVHVAGMSRAGTTYLYHNLQLHPQLFLPERKETCYFGHENHRGLDWWLDFYKGIRRDQKAVDICGLYFMEDAAIDRILEFNPGAKVIVVLREPMQWVYSIYEHYSTLFEVPPIEQFITGCIWNRDGINIALEFANSKIERTVERMRQRLGSNLLLIDFNLFSEDPLCMLKAVEQFCEVEPWFSEDNFSKARVNARGRGSGKRIARISKIPGVPLLARIMPRQAMMAARRHLESDDGKPVPERARPIYTDEQRSMVERLMADDQAYQSKLFARGPIVIG